jgi:hypothetical protein
LPGTAGSAATASGSIAWQPRRQYVRDKFGIERPRQQVVGTVERDKALRVTGGVEDRARIVYANDYVLRRM